MEVQGAKPPCRGLGWPQMFLFPKMLGDYAIGSLGGAYRDVPQTFSPQPVLIAEVSYEGCQEYGSILFVLYNVLNH